MEVLVKSEISGIDSKIQTNNAFECYISSPNRILNRDLCSIIFSFT